MNNPSPVITPRAGRGLTVLHVSDVHRSSDDPVRNSSLVAALAADRDRWPARFDAGPDLIVVSGDVVQGVPVGVQDHEVQLEAQYQEAYAFLVGLCDRFVGGDRSKVAVIPGNHDVDWNQARAAMEPVADEEVLRLSGALPDIAMAAKSPYRWDWKEQRLLKIVDRGAYERRLEPFLRFRSRFYERVVPDPLVHEHDLFFRDYEDLGVSITGFSSWDGNDCYCPVGSIDPDTLAAARDLIAASSCEVHLAVWHHSYSGPPSRSDYLDIATVRTLLDYGYRIGLHGHQHRAGFSVVPLRLPTSEQMALVAAGSLCVGHRELPVGINRQYNLLDIDLSIDSIRVHLREAIGELIFAEGRRVENGYEDPVEIGWTPAPARGTGVALQVAQLDRAFDAYGRKDLRTAAEILEVLPSADSTARRLRIQVLTELGDYAKLVDELANPRDPDEAIALVDVLLRLGEYDKARQALRDGAERFGMTRDIRVQVETRITVQEMAP